MCKQILEHALDVSAVARNSDIPISDFSLVDGPGREPGPARRYGPVKELKNGATFSWSRDAVHGKS